MLGSVVKMRRGYSAPGIVVKVFDITPDNLTRWVRVLWSDSGVGLEKKKDLIVISERE